MTSAFERMKNLIGILNEASKVYYQGKDEIMSNLEYDKLYDELCELEKETGVTLAGSPTSSVGYEVLSELPKERHAYPVLSLDKTKEVSDLVDWLSDKQGVLSWKLDGLTVVLSYENGTLVKAVTRGNGEIGEVITNNARTFVNIPLSIAYKEKLIIRGEALIKYSDFEKINASIENPDEKYKNPRNLCSGSVRQLNNEITAKRNVYFLAYNVLESGNSFKKNSEVLEWLKGQGFEVVGYDIVNSSNIADYVEDYSKQIEKNDFPSDGLVLNYDDIAYGESLGRTAKFPRHSIAFKWADELAETRLKEIEWSASRTGLINPVAIFEAVELEGTTVSRASVHNLSIVEELKLGIGDSIKVYKANMIIPQIAENLTKSGKLTIPKQCPVCAHETEVRQENGVKTLYCPNPLCLAKHIKSFTHFVSREAMNIDGLSEASIEKFIGMKIITNFDDIYHIDRYEEDIVDMPGFGRKSYENLIKAIEDSRNVEMPNFINSLGITGIGLTNARTICQAFSYDIERIINASVEELLLIEGIGDVLANEWVKYMQDANNMNIIRKLINELSFIIPEENNEEKKLAGLTLVITGSLNNFSSRNELKKIIEGLGGKVTGGVTGKTDYLINNDINSASSKNKKAKELGVPIITEQEFITSYNINI